MTTKEAWIKRKERYGSSGCKNPEERCRKLSQKMKGRDNSAWKNKTGATIHKRVKEGKIIYGVGKDGRNYQGGKPYLSKNGYLVIKRDGIKWYLHNYIYCSQPENLNYIPEGFCVHHLNGSKLDNRPENLVLLPRGYHSGFHSHMRRLERNELYLINNKSL